MFAKSISTLLVLSGIALGTTSASLSQTNAKEKLSFVCATNTNPPTTFAYRQGEVTLTPLFSWYSEYLLPGNSASELCKSVAQKLQSKYNQGQKYFLAYEKINDSWKVCLVSKEGGKCTSDKSEELFSLNSTYQAPKCVMENTEPKSCPPTPPSIGYRGPLLSVPGGRYKPAWWFF
jgi:hypothetical protein